MRSSHPDVLTVRTATNSLNGHGPSFLGFFWTTNLRNFLRRFLAGPAHVLVIGFLSLQLDGLKDIRLTGQNRQSCSECRRELLCIECNMLLGLAHDDPETLRALATYLERYS